MCNKHQVIILPVRTNMISNKTCKPNLFRLCIEVCHSIPPTQEKVEYKINKVWQAAKILF